MELAGGRTAAAAAAAAAERKLVVIVLLLGSRIGARKKKDIQESPFWLGCVISGTRSGEPNQAVANFPKPGPPRTIPRCLGGCKDALEKLP